MIMATKAPAPPPKAKPKLKVVEKEPAAPDFDPYTVRIPTGLDEKPAKTPTNREDGVIAVNIGKLNRALDKFETQNGSLRATIKDATAKGIHMKAYRRARAVMKSDDPASVIEELQKLFEYLMIMNCPIERSQLDMFRVLEPRTPGEEKAYDQGRYAGLMSLGSDASPYGIDSKAGKKWREGWNDGNDERENAPDELAPGETVLIKHDTRDEPLPDIDIVKDFESPFEGIPEA